MVTLCAAVKGTEGRGGSLTCLRSNSPERDLGESDLNPLSTTNSLWPQAMNFETQIHPFHTGDFVLETQRKRNSMRGTDAAPHPCLGLSFPTTKSPWPFQVMGCELRHEPVQHGEEKIWGRVRASFMLRHRGVPECTTTLSNWDLQGNTWTIWRKLSNHLKGLKIECAALGSNVTFVLLSHFCFFITAEKRIAGSHRACVGIHLGDDTGLKWDSNSGDGEGDKAMLARRAQKRQELGFPLPVQWLQAQCFQYRECRFNPWSGN